MADTEDANVQLQHAMAADVQSHRDDADNDEELQRVLELSVAEEADRRAVAEAARHEAANGRNLGEVDDEFEMQQAIQASMQGLDFSLMQPLHIDSTAAASNGTDLGTTSLDTAAAPSDGADAQDGQTTLRATAVEQHAATGDDELQQALDMSVQSLPEVSAGGPEALAEQGLAEAVDGGQPIEQGPASDAGATQEDEQSRHEASMAISLSAAQQEHTQAEEVLTRAHELQVAADETVQQAELALQVAQQHAATQREACEEAEHALGRAVERLLGAAKHARPERDNEIRNLRARVDQQEERTMCAVCMETERSITLRPCGHMCLCVGCAPIQSICPICRADVTERIRSVLA